MTGSEFLENINSIDSDLILEAENWVDHKSRNLKILSGIAAAAAACLCFAAGFSAGSSREKTPTANDIPALSGGNTGNSVNADSSGEDRLVGCRLYDIYPTIMVNGRLYEWKAYGRSVIDDWDLPKGCVYRGKILYMPGKEVPEDEREFVADYKASGLVFLDPEEDIVYLQMTTDWLDNKFVVFEPVETSERYQQEEKAREEAEQNNSQTE